MRNKGPKAYRITNHICLTKNKALTESLAAFGKENFPFCKKRKISVCIKQLPAPSLASVS